MDTNNSFKPQDLLQQLPHRYGYANKIVQMLQLKGINVSQTKVYHVIAGKSHDLEIITALIEIVEAYKASQNSLNERFKNLQTLS